VWEHDGEHDNVLETFVTKLGTTYDDEEHGIALRHLAVLAGDNKQGRLHKEAFVGWYMEFLFKMTVKDYDDDEDESNVEVAMME
jgi:hypothetical protein